MFTFYMFSFCLVLFLLVVKLTADDVTKHCVAELGKQPEMCALHEVLLLLANILYIY